jgi:hypothetical protein
VTDETPDGLHRNQYATHLLEEILGWPSKGNLELMADCLLSISKSRHISIKQAHGYMERAIRLAREQCIEIDGHWFRNGEYTKMRPAEKFNGTWKDPSLPVCTLCGDSGWRQSRHPCGGVVRCKCPPEAKKKPEYVTPEEAKEILAKLGPIAERKLIPATSERRKELREQVAKIQEAKP